MANIDTSADFKVLGNVVQEEMELFEKDISSCKYISDSEEEEDTEGGKKGGSTDSDAEGEDPERDEEGEGGKELVHGM
jgi:hypothetical protein